MTLYVFLAGFGIMCASLLSIFFISKQSEEFVTHNMPYLISFSAGVFLFTTGIMITEAYHIFENILYVLAGVLVGYTFANVLVYIMPRIHHHHDECCEGHEAKGRNVLIADGLHNVADGLILVPAFIISPLLGFGTAISLFIHEALQGVSEFFVLKRSGYSTIRALLYNFLVSSTILVGIAIGLFTVNTVFLQGILLSLAAGLFAYIIFHDLLPHKHHPDASRHTWVTHILIILCGVLLLGVVNYFLAESHNHEHEAPQQQSLNL